MLADDETGNQLGVGIQRNPRPDIAQCSGIPAFDILLFLTDESPNLINLDVAAWQVDHLLVHDGFTARTDTKAKTHNRIAINASANLTGRILCDCRCRPSL
jgi:hypothetical protein